MGGRILFEYTHKTSGYLVIVLGIANIVYGIVLVFQKGYNTMTIIVAAMLAMIAEFPVIAFVLLMFTRQNNSCVVSCLRKYVRDEERLMSCLPNVVNDEEHSARGLKANRSDLAQTCGVSNEC